MRDRRLVVLGLGNPLRGDDAAGLRVAEEVAGLLRERPVEGVSVATSSRAGLEIIELLRGAAGAIVVDCLAMPAAHPGRVRRLSLEDCAGSARLVGAHDLSLADAFALARAAGVAMPHALEIFGIEAEDTERIDDRLSPAVSSAAERLAAEIFERISTLDG